MKDALNTIPPFALFLAGFASVVAYGLFQLHAVLAAHLG